MLKELSISGPYGKPNVREFNLIANNITSLFLSFICEKKFGQFEFITILLIEEKDQELEFLHDYEFPNSLGIKMYFDFERFEQLSLLKKKNKLLKLLKRLLRITASKFSLEITFKALEKAALETSKDSFKWHGFATKKTILQKKGLVAKVSFKYSEEKEVFKLFLCIYEKEKLKKKIKFMETFPSKDILEKITRKFDWINEQELILGPEDYMGYKLIINTQNNTIKILGTLPDYYSVPPHTITDK